MKSILFFSIVAALLGGCVMVPFDYGDQHEGHYQDRGYHRGDGYYPQRDHYRGDGNYHDEWHRGGQGDPFWDRGS